MRVINTEQLKSILANLPSNPRIIASGNFSTPRTLLAIADEVIPETAKGPKGWRNERAWFGFFWIFFIIGLVYNFFSD